MKQIKSQSVLGNEEAAPVSNPFTPKAKPAKKASTPRGSKLKKPAKKAGGAKKKEGKIKVRKPGSGALIRELLKQGKGTEAILKAVHAKFPDSKAKASDVSWNKSMLAKGRF